MAVADCAKISLAVLVVALLGGIHSKVGSWMVPTTSESQASRHSSSSIEASSLDVEASCDVDVAQVAVREVRV